MSKSNNDKSNIYEATIVLLLWGTGLAIATINITAKIVIKTIYIKIKDNIWQSSQLCDYVSLFSYLVHFYMFRILLMLYLCVEFEWYRTRRYCPLIYPVADLGKQRKVEHMWIHPVYIVCRGLHANTTITLRFYKAVSFNEDANTSKNPAVTWLRRRMVKFGYNEG